jgi:hypothetical protein
MLAAADAVVGAKAALTTKGRTNNKTITFFISATLAMSSSRSTDQLQKNKSLSG